MTTDPPKPFCPECQATWDQPWYDVCPACQHRFKERPWWQSPWLVLVLICLPALAMFPCALVPQSWSSAVGIHDPAEIAAMVALIGSGVTALPAGILLACRLGASIPIRVLLSIVFIPLIWVVSVCLSFFACALIRQ